MKKSLLLTLFSIGIAGLVNAQLTPELSIPVTEATGESPIFESATKAPGDSCGIYYNNYIGLVKTSSLFFEPMRTGNASPSENGYYAGRAQLFHAPQPIEVSGIQFYAHQTNLTVDSLPVIAILYDYDDIGDVPGVELARDTVWVTENTFDPVLPNREVNATFPAVTVTEDYMIAIVTETDDSIKVYTSDAGGDGAGEGVSYIFYKNEAGFPGFEQWYNTLGTFGPTYDIDYLISPLVKYDLHDGYTLDNDSICPNITSAACVEYFQNPIYGDPHYSGNSGSPTSNIQWLWGDGFQNTMITSACHTYASSGTFTISLKDSLVRHMFTSPYCPTTITKEIVVRDSTIADFNVSSVGFTADFTNTSTDYDSVAWDFGDGNMAGNEETPTNVYPALGDYDVWVYAYGPCNTDSMMMTITISDVGINKNELSLNAFPNPAKDQFVVNGDYFDAQITVYNIVGEVVTQHSNVSQKITYNTSSWPTGSYFVEVVTDKSKKTIKMIIQH